MNNVCPTCNSLQDIGRPEIGALSTWICDQCYYDRFKDAPSEQSYFAKTADFWKRFADEATT